MDNLSLKAAARRAQSPMFQNTKVNVGKIVEKNGSLISNLVWGAMCWLLQSALKTYYNVLFNLRFEELPLSTDPEISTPAVSREHEPFIIELPSLPCVSRIDNERIDCRRSRSDGDRGDSAQGDSTRGDQNPTAAKDWP